jgi:hypothetical protein
MRLIIAISFCFTTNLLLGQETGLDLGFNVSIMTRSNSIETRDNTNFNKITNSNRWGFDLGFSFYYIFNDHFEMRSTPTMGFEEDKIVYTRQGLDESLLFGPTFLKLPTHGILKLNRKIPLGLVFGATPNIQLSQMDDAPVDKIRLGRNEITVDLGLNCRIGLPWFVISPEIKYCKSMTNVAGDQRTEYGQAISSFYRDRIIYGIYVRHQFE